MRLKCVYGRKYPERGGKMNQKRLAGLLCLLLATAGAVAVAQTPLAADVRVSAPEQPSEEDRTALWTYFSEHYSEGNCSAVYTDVTHDGVEDLVVLEMEAGNEPILIHENRPDMEQVTGGTVTVLHRDAHGTVEPIFSYTLDREARGGLYLQKQDGLVYLLWRTPSETELFFLSETGQKMTAEAAQADERETEEAKLLLAFDPETQTGSSMEYLDELFTMY